MEQRSAGAISQGYCAYLVSGNSTRHLVSHASRTHLRLWPFDRTLQLTDKINLLTIVSAMPTTEQTIDWSKPQPAPLALWRLTKANVPEVRNLGIYNNRNVAGTSIPSAHAEGRALDIGLYARNPKEKYLGDQLFAGLIESASQSGIDHVIWNREIWSTTHPSLLTYTGVNPHIDHIHVAFTRDGSQKTSFPLFQQKLAILRSAREDLRRGFANIA